MLWSSKLPQDADFGSWKDDNYPKTPKGWRRQGLGTVVILWPERSREIENARSHLAQVFSMRRRTVSAMAFRVF